MHLGQQIGDAGEQRQKVQQCAGLGGNGREYILDLLRGGAEKGVEFLDEGVGVTRIGAIFQVVKLGGDPGKPNGPGLKRPDGGTQVVQGDGHRSGERKARGAKIVARQNGADRARDCAR